MSITYNVCCIIDIIIHYSNNVQSRNLCMLLCFHWFDVSKLPPIYIMLKLLGIYRIVWKGSGWPQWGGTSLETCFKSASVAAVGKVITCHHPLLVLNDSSHSWLRMYVCASCSSNDASFKSFAIKLSRMKISWMANWPWNPWKLHTSEICTCKILKQMILENMFSCNASIRDQVIKTVCG